MKDYTKALETALSELGESLDENDLADAVAIIWSLHLPDQADTVEELAGPDQVTLMSRLNPSNSAGVLDRMDDEQAAALAKLLAPETLAVFIGKLAVNSRGEAIVKAREAGFSVDYPSPW